MAYATLTDLENSALGGALGSITVAARTQALDDASDLIDSYLRGKFTLPLVSYGSDITACCVVLARYDLMVAKGFAPRAGSDENFRLTYEDKIAWLRSVSSGTATPNVTDSSAGALPGVPSSRPRVFSASSRGYSSRTNGRTPPGGFQGD